MSDIQTMKEMITGLKAKKKSLRADEAIFLKLAGINEEIEKANQDKDGFETELIEAKERRDSAKKKKADSVSKTTFEIMKKMNEVLPSGEAVFTYNEDDEGKRSMQIGWGEQINPGRLTITPYNGLSGMQKQVFDAALANVLDANIIVLEAAELDNDNLIKTLKELSKLDKQVIVNTCHLNENNMVPFQIIEV